MLWAYCKLGAPKSSPSISKHLSVMPHWHRQLLGGVGCCTKGLSLIQKWYQIHTVTGMLPLPRQHTPGNCLRTHKCSALRWIAITPPAQVAFAAPSSSSSCRHLKRQNTTALRCPHPLTPPANIDNANAKCQQYPMLTNKTKLLAKGAPHALWPHRTFVDGMVGGARRSRGAKQIK